MEDAITLSGVAGIGFRAEAAIEGGGMILESEGTRAPGRGDAGGGSTSEGDAERGGALNGWKDMDERLPWPEPPSPARAAARPAGLILLAMTFRGAESVGDGDVAPGSLAARRAEIGLAPVGGPTWWKVDKLP